MVKFSRDSFFLLIVNMLFGASMIIAATFINVFIMRSTDNNVSLIIGRSILDAIVLLIAFVSGTKLLRFVKITNIMRIGLLAITTYYVLIIVFQNHISTIIVPLGMMSGLGNGLYWFASNILLMEHVKAEQQAKFFSYRQTAGFIFGVAIPFVSGLVIAQFTDLTGYFLLFGVSVVLFIIAAILLQFISGFKAHREIRVKEALLHRKNRYWASAKFLTFTAGLREQVIAFVMVLFLFHIFQSEVYIGGLSSAGALIGVVSSLIFARIFKPTKRKHYYFIVTIALSTMYVLQALFPYPIMIVIAMMVIGIFTNWGMTIMQTMFYQLAVKARGEDYKNDFLVAGEFPMAAGRILGLVAALAVTQLLPDPLYAYRMLFVLVGLTWVFEFVYVNRKVGWLSE